MTELDYILGSIPDIIDMMTDDGVLKLLKMLETKSESLYKELSNSPNSKNILEKLDRIKRIKKIIKEAVKESDRQKLLSSLKEKAAEKIAEKIAKTYLRFKYGKYYDAPMWREEGNRFAQEILSLLKKE